MQRTPIESSNLRSVGYDEVDLEIEFRSGHVYIYYNVPRGVYEGLMAAPSHRRYFHRHIRNVYNYARIR